MRRNLRYSAVFLAALSVCLITGCSGTEVKNRLVSRIAGDDKQSENDAEPSPTPTPLPTATPVPATPTPVPTSTPAPRRIGTKTPQSKYLYLTNGLVEPLRELYFRGSGGEDWGKNMIPVESTVKVSEKVQLCYPPSDTSDGSYDLKVVDKKGNAYAVYGINTEDFEECTIRFEEDKAFLSYISKTSGEEERAESSETLAQNYETSRSSGSGSSSHEGDYNYGYYDDYGNWVEYDYSDYSSYSDNSGSSYDSSQGYYDDYGNWVSYYDSSGSYDYYDYSEQSGYYDDYGNFISYY